MRPFLSLLFLAPILLSCGSDESGSGPVTGGGVALCKQAGGKVECSIKDLSIDAGCILLAGTEGRDFAIADAVVKDGVVTFLAPAAGTYDFRYGCGDKTTTIHEKFVVNALTSSKSTNTNPKPGPAGGGGGSGGGGGGGGGDSGKPNLCYDNDGCRFPRQCKEGACVLPNDRCEKKEDCKTEGQLCNTSSYRCQFEPGRCAKEDEGKDCSTGKKCLGTYCKVPPLPPPVCGNGKVETGEECDGGKDGSATCTKDCKTILPTLKVSIQAKPVESQFGVYEISYEIKEKYQQAQLIGPFSRTEFAEGCGDEAKGDFIVNNDSGSVISKDTENYDKYKPYLIGEKCDEGKKNCFGYAATMVSENPNPIPPTASLVLPKSWGERLRTALSPDNLFLKNAYSYSAASYSAHSSGAYVGSYFDILGGMGEFKETTTCKIDLKDKSAKGTFYVRLNQRNAKFRIAATDDGVNWKSDEKALKYDVKIKGFNASIDKTQPRFDVSLDYENTREAELWTKSKNRMGDEFTKVECAKGIDPKKDAKGKEGPFLAGSGSIKWTCPLTHLYNRITVKVKGVGIDNYQQQVVIVELGNPVVTLKKGAIACGKDETVPGSGTTSDDDEDTEGEGKTGLDEGGDDKDPKEMAGVNPKHCKGAIPLHWTVKRDVWINGELLKDGIPWVKSIELWQFDNEMHGFGSKPITTVDTNEKIGKGTGDWTVQREHRHTKWVMIVNDYDGKQYWKETGKRFFPSFKVIMPKKHNGCGAKEYKKEGSTYGTCVDPSGRYAKGEIAWTGRHIKKVRAECQTSYFAFGFEDPEKKVFAVGTRFGPWYEPEIDQPSADSYVTQSKTANLTFDFPDMMSTDDGRGGKGYCFFYATTYLGEEIRYKKKGLDLTWGCHCNSEGWFVPDE